MTEELERQVDMSNSILERKVLCEVITTTREIKVITELQTFLRGISILISMTMIYLSMLRVKKRSYYEVVHLPNGVSGRGLKSTFLNGILEVTLHNTNKTSRI